MNKAVPSVPAPFAAEGSRWDRQTLEARYALRVAAQLHASTRALPHDVTERLRFAREQALERSRQRIVSPVAARNEASASFGASVLTRGGGPQGPGWWWRLASLVPVLALAVGLVAAQLHHENEQIQATADIDAALLSDDLPPAAYSDLGFAEFLKTGGSAPAAP